MTRSRRSARRQPPGCSCGLPRSLKSFGVVLVALLTAFAAGCGGNGDGDRQQPSPAATAPSGTTSSGTSPSETLPSGPTAQSGSTATQPAAPRARSKNRSQRTETQETSPSKGGEPSGGTGSTPGSRRVERYLRENFGGGGGGAKTVWYDHVEEVAVSGATTTVKTDLSDDRAGRRLGKQICLDVRGSIPGITDTVRVTGSAGGSTLARCVP
jgi:hypothetical protein